MRLWPSAGTVSWRSALPHDVRYADDFVILCQSREEADAALDLVRYWVSDNGLTLHPEKTHVGDCRQPGHGFEFLGYRFEAGRRFVRKKSLDKLADSIRDKTRRTRGDSLAHVIADLNPVSCRMHATRMTRLVRLLQASPLDNLRRSRRVQPSCGACGARHAERAGHDMRSVRGTTCGACGARRRLRSLLLKQNKRSAIGISRAVNQRWPNAFFAHAGLFAMNTAWQSARRSR